jgi:quercetin dioxygenase-like cupin family protein
VPEESDAGRRARVTRDVNADGNVTEYLQGSGPLGSKDRSCFFEVEGAESPHGPEHEARLWARALVNPAEHEGCSLVSVRYGPNVVIGHHSHDTAQIILIWKGEVRQGNKVLRAGEGYYTPGGARYSITAGPQGVTTLEFRPTSLDFSSDFDVDPHGAEASS